MGVLTGLAVGESRTLRGREQQQDFGAWLAARLPVGSVLFLEGELGAGKTTLTQGIARALGFGDAVTSPTYALMQPYPTPQGTLLHVDAYRMTHAGELYDMGLEDLIESSRLSVVEWGAPLYGDFVGAPILRLEHLTDEEDVRRVERVR